MHKSIWRPGPQWELAALPHRSPELDLRGKRRFAAGKDRGGRTGTGQKGEMRDHSPYHKLVDLPRSTDENPDPIYTEKGKTMASRNMHAKLRKKQYRSN